MQYRGFNKIELKKITEILDLHHVQYHVSVPEESLDFINDPTKRVNHKFIDSLMQVEIEKEEFDKISQADIAKLFDLRIYKEEDSPFSEEELANLGNESKTPEEKKKDPHARMNQIAAILAVGVVVFFSLWKKGMFK